MNLGDLHEVDVKMNLSKLKWVDEISRMDLL
jgi:hypothetical protein